MFEIIDIPQRSEAWHSFRRNHIGSSDCPAILGVSRSKSQYDLWLEKTNLDLSEKYVSPAMQRGIDLEATALECFNRLIGIKFYPVVIKSKKYPWMSASLDGISECGRYFVEIKVPGVESHLKALSENVPEIYYPQLQHIHECGEFDGGYYFSFDGEDGIYLKVDRDQPYIDDLIEKEKEFWDCVQTLTEPKSKYIEKDNQEWKNQALIYAQLHGEKEAIDRELELARDTLIQLAGDHAHCRGSGITVSRLQRKGAIDYGKIAELKNVNLETYRKKSVEYWRIDID
jgi:putative phage-type endonuclease